MAHRHEFKSLVQGERSVAKYEAKFFRLSRYARRLVLNNYERSIQFDKGLRYDLRVLIAH